MKREFIFLKLVETAVLERDGILNNIVGTRRLERPASATILLTRSGLRVTIGHLTVYPVYPCHIHKRVT